jgi:hypothetical protein
MAKPIAIRWTCGVVPGHEHATEAEAWKCIWVHTGIAPIGLCPICGAPGRFRERRIHGDDICENGHHYPSVEAIQDPTTKDEE